MDDDSVTGVLGSMRFGGDLATKEFGDRMEEVGDEPEECVEEVEGEGDGSRGILL